jgi:thiol-disulfide isomerase/thioredoxin
VKPAQLAQLVIVVLAALGVYGFVLTARDAERRRHCTPLCAMRPAYAAQNRLAPDFELPALAGGKSRLSDYRGKVVILNFWTKTCGPCLEEMPSLAELAKVLEGNKHIALVTISTDESVEDVQGTLRSVLGGPPPFAVLVDPDAEVVSGKFGTKLFPETWFIDRDGVIRARFDGARDWSEALPIDLAKSLLDPAGCGIDFSAGRAVGKHASLCQDVGVSG